MSRAIWREEQQGSKGELLIEESTPQPGDRYQERNGRKQRTHTKYFTGLAKKFV